MNVSENSKFGCEKSTENKKKIKKKSEFIRLNVQQYSAEVLGQPNIRQESRMPNSVRTFVTPLPLNMSITSLVNDSGIFYWANGQVNESNLDTTVIKKIVKFMK